MLFRSRIALYTQNVEKKHCLEKRNGILHKNRRERFEKSYIPLHGDRGVKNFQNHPYVMNEWPLSADFAVRKVFISLYGLNLVDYHEARWQLRGLTTPVFCNGMGPGQENIASISVFTIQDKHMTV